MKPRRLVSATTLSITWSRGTVMLDALPLRRFAPPPHEWGGATPFPLPVRGGRSYSKNCPSGASRHLPMNGEDQLHFHYLRGGRSYSKNCPSGASRHLPMNGEDQHLPMGGEDGALSA